MKRDPDAAKKLIANLAYDFRDSGDERTFSAAEYAACLVLAGWEQRWSDAQDTALFLGRESVYIDTGTSLVTYYRHGANFKKWNYKQFEPECIYPWDLPRIVKLWGKELLAETP